MDQYDETRRTMSKRNQGGGAFFGGVSIFFALLFIILPVVFASYIGGAAQMILIGFGVILLLVGGIVVIITKLYQKTTASMAFVRTGMGGRKVIIDGGGLVIPVVHNIIEVSLETMRLDVRRTGTNALITGDNLRVDIESEFYISVKPDEVAIKTASTSLGERSINSDSIKDLVEQKLVSALRTVAATKTLNDLHTKRDEFTEAVSSTVTRELEANGLTLESVTVSSLDQTPLTDISADKNIFDAQGAKAIAQIVQRQRVEKVAIETLADQEVRAKEVERDKYIFEQDVARQQAEAKKRADIQKADAQADRDAATFAAERAQETGVAQVKSDAAIQLAEVEKTKTLEVADQAREQAQQEAEVRKNEAVEIARRNKEIAITNKEKEKVDAETKRLAAAVGEETKRQEVKTVEVVQTAERDKAKLIVNEQAEIEKKRQRDVMEADVEKYEITTKASAEQEAAAQRAEAVRVEADAAKDAALAKAEGERAIQSVPVDVDRKRVEVESERVLVKEKDLKIQSEHQEIAKELEIAKLTIAAQQAIGIAFAEATGTALAGADMQIYGTPETMNNMMDNLFKGQGFAKLLEGFQDVAPDSVKTAGKGLFDTLTGLLNKIGADVKPATVKEVVDAVVSETDASPANDTAGEEEEKD
ncbi:MAG: SPFH domain-containing protein [Candidatus Komeilibacteria bacterium]